MPSSSPAARAFVPVKPVVLEILMALAGDPLHGYAVLQMIREQSGGQIELQTGPLYRHLKRLLDEGLVQEREAPTSVGDDDERRRYYSLSPLGRDVVALEGERLAALVARGRSLGAIAG